MLLFSRFPLCSYSSINLHPILLSPVLPMAQVGALSHSPIQSAATIITLYLCLYLSNLSLGLTSPSCLAAQIAISSCNFTRHSDCINFSKYNACSQAPLEKFPHTAQGHKNAEAHPPQLGPFLLLPQHFKLAVKTLSRCLHP